jgi:hypothetical protein
MRSRLRINSSACCLLAVIVVATPVVAQVTDPFAYGLANGEVLWEGNSQYNTKWHSAASNQKELFSFATSGGNPDGAGRLNVALAERDYIARNINGIVVPAAVGNMVTISGDFQIAITGAALNSGQDGTDDSLIGLQLATTPNWWDGAPFFDFTVIRRSNSTWGVKFGGTPMGSEPNSEIGLGDGAGASTGGWLTLTMKLTDNGTGYEATASVLYNGLPVWTAPSAIAAPYSSGASLWGGITTGFNTDTGLDPDISPKSVGDLGKLSSAVADNFFLGVQAVPEPNSAVLAIAGLLGALRRRPRRGPHAG